MKFLVTLAIIAAWPAFSVPALSKELSTKAGSLTLQSLGKFEHPWSVSVLPDGSALVTEKPGRLRRVSGTEISSPITGVPQVAYEGQGGLLGLVLDPKFAETGVLYLAYAEAAPEQPADATDPGDARLTSKKRTDTVLKGLAVARARLDGTALKDLQVIWRQEPKTIGRGHFGGRMAFGQDGLLYITSGERQRFEPAQDPRSHLAKILRIKTDGSSPHDNPFSSEQGRPDIFSLGHRNPLGIAVEPATGRLWIHEMGPKGGDEFNEVVKGANYGWPEVSDGVHYNDAKIPLHAASTQFKKPALSWTPSISPSGLIFYTGDMFPHWKGKAILGGLSSEALLVLSVGRGSATEDERIPAQMRIRDVAQAPDGSLLILSDGAGGELLRLTPKASTTQ